MLNNNTCAPARPQESGNAMTNIVTFLHQLESERYFGKVEPSFQSGHVVNLCKEESLRPADIHNLVANSKGNNHVHDSK
jgi:hypothetical protein